MIDHSSLRAALTAQTRLVIQNRPSPHSPVYCRCAMQGVDLMHGASIDPPSTHTSTRISIHKLHLAAILLGKTPPSRHPLRASTSDTFLKVSPTPSSPPIPTSSQESGSIIRKIASAGSSTRFLGRTHRNAGLSQPRFRRPTHKPKLLSLTLVLCVDFLHSSRCVNFLFSCRPATLPCPLTIIRGGRRAVGGVRSHRAV